MTADDKIVLRLQYLSRVVAKEAQYLATTNQRLFDSPFTPQRAARLESDPDLAERVDAFVSRFGRLQDTIGDRLLPALLAALGEPVAAAIDNLDRAERLELIDSADDWLATRRLRNQMIHEYVEDLTMLASALETGHAFVSVLTGTAHRLIADIQRRGWA
jgi:hypothetical protein